MSSDGGSDPQTAGRSGRPKIRQRSSSSSWMQRTPAGLPSGMPGIGLLIDGAMQQAAQWGRQFMTAGLSPHALRGRQQGPPAMSLRQ